MNKYVVIPIAGQVTIDLPDDFEGDEDAAFQWAMDNLPQDFSLDNSGTADVQWDFYRHISQGNVWWAETPPSITVEEW